MSKMSRFAVALMAKLAGIGFHPVGFAREQEKAKQAPVDFGVFNRDLGKDKRKRPVWLHNKMLDAADVKRERKDEKRAADYAVSQSGYYWNWS